MRTLEEVQAGRVALRVPPGQPDPDAAAVNAALEVADSFDGIGEATSFPADMEWALPVLAAALRQYMTGGTS